jgi:hypothetical protein
MVPITRSIRRAVGAGVAVWLVRNRVRGWNDPARSEDYARRVRGVTPDVCRFVVRDAGHAMLRRAGDWTGLVRAFVAGTIGAAAPDPLIVAAMRTPAPDGLRLVLPRRPW